MRENIKMVDGNSLAVNQYEIFVRVNGRCRVVVNAVDFKSAKELAEERVGEYNFGELEDIDWGAVSGIDERGNYVSFKKRGAV